jgi:putative cardiolipin synthase
MLLADAAERSLDAQYYLWHGDQTGYLLYEAAWRAAGRGVRVRLLLDDNGTGGLDGTLAALDAHPNVEVRLYNPLANRGLRALNYVADFSRVNRRMHNKSFTVDGQATIVGGRNVGNEYFSAGSGLWFQDLDVIAVGPVVRDVSAAFDLYWNSASAYPVELLLEHAPADAARLQERFAAVRADPVSVAYAAAVRETPLVQRLLAGDLPLEWATARVFYDDPAKTLDASGRTDLLLLSPLLQAMGPPETSVDLVSPYFVPAEHGTATFVALAGRGVKVRVLVNSLATTDVSAVHAGYRKRREELLEAGVVLYEMKPREQGGAEREKAAKSGASSAGSLHAKTFAIDGRRIFVGSFNFDPRSARLNTEMGLLIESPALAGRLTQIFNEDAPASAYEVRLTADGRDIEWIDRAGPAEEIYDTEPETGLMRRALVRFLSWLPIDWML